MEYAFNATKTVALPIVGSDKDFPVRRIYCVGKNYLDHIIEMGGDAKRSEPVIFTKSAQTIVQNGTDITFPPNTDNLHYEVELVVAIGPQGIFGYGVGIDMTRRDLQAKAKAKGAPWDRAKNFTDSAPCSAITKASQVDLKKARITLRHNDKIVQDSHLDKMIWSVTDIVTFIAQDMDLQAGDLIFTGTPEGVGPVSIGDTLVASINGLSPLKVKYI